MNKADSLQKLTEVNLSAFVTDCIKKISAQSSKQIPMKFVPMIEKNSL